MIEAIAFLLVAGMAFVYWMADRHDEDDVWVGDQMGGHWEHK